MFVKDVFKILTSPLFCHICYHQKIPLQNLQRKCGLSLFQNLLLKFHYIKIFSNTVFATSLEHSNSPGLFLPMDCQFLAAWSTSISHFKGSTSIPSVLCSSESNGRPMRLFFKLVLPARSWPMSIILLRYTVTYPSFKTLSWASCTLRWSAIWPN